MSGFKLASRAMDGGASTTGTITLSAPASAATTVTLSSSDPSVVLPTSVTVPSGATTTPAFAVTTRQVSADSVVTLAAGLSGQSYKTTMTLWRIAPNSVWYESQPSGNYAHYSDAATYSASCAGDRLDIRINGSTTLAFRAFAGQPLRPGTYSLRGSNATPTIGVSDTNTNFDGCFYFGSTGQFVIDEADISTAGEVRRFIASFDLACTDRGTTLHGTVKLTSVPAVISSFSGCLR